MSRPSSTAPGLLGGELVLEGQERIAHRLVGRISPMRILPWRRHAGGDPPIARRERLGRTGSSRDVGERDFLVDERAGDSPVEQAGIEMSEAEMLRKPACRVFPCPRRRARQWR